MGFPKRRAGRTRRSIGQERFGFAEHARSTSSLDDRDKLFKLDTGRGSSRSALFSHQGRPAWLPLAMFRMLLLSIWYDLSDVKPAEALHGRASFRRFCGFIWGTEATPERTAFVQGAGRPEAGSTAAHDCDSAAHLQSSLVKTGTLVDATIIAPPSPTISNAP
jgi:transposase, IS5 family